MARLTIALLTKREKLIDTNANLKGKLDANNREIERINKLAKETLTDHDGDELTKGKFKLDWERRPQSVPWKSELVKAIGADKVAKIAKRAKETLVSRLRITKL